MSVETPSGRSVEVPQEDFDHHGPEFAADPLGTVARLRENRVTYSPRNGGFYVLARYEDVRQGALDNKTLTQGRDPHDPIKLGAQIPPSEFGLIVPSEADAPSHTAYRRALQPWFTAKMADEREHRLRHWTDVCLDEVIESGRIDFVTDLTGPVAFLFFCEMLGLPLDDWRRWQDPVHQLMTFAPGSPQAVQALIDEQGNTEALMAIADDRRENPREDMITALTRATHPDGTPFSSHEVAAASKNVMLGAVDSVGGLIAHTLRYLDQHPGERQRLLDDPSLLESAIEEFLRYFSPGTNTGRTVSRETELHGQKLYPGDRVMLTWMAANHDPEIFEAPEEVRLERSPNKHLAFGVGIHKCNGIQFARLEARVFVEQVLERMPDYKILEEEAVPMASMGLFSGYWHMPATFAPGTRRQSDRRPG